MSVLTIDFETFSECDLIKCGSWVYSRDPSTEILCLAYKFENTETFLWTPKDEPPKDLFEFIEGGGSLEAHNAQFEHHIWNNCGVKKYGFPKLYLSQIECSASKAAALALPRSLGDVGAALKLGVQKDMEGRRLMLKLSKPRKPTKHNPSTRHNKPEEMERLYQYCIRDVETEFEVSNRLRDLTPKEMKIWQLDQKINNRGIYCDVKAVKVAIDFLDKYKKEAVGHLKRMTDGEVTSPLQRDKLLNWLNERGAEMKDLTKASVEEALNRVTCAKLYEMLKLRQSMSKTSTAKFKKMLMMADYDDHRIRGTMMYHGAATGRWSGKGVQVQNLPRGTIKDVDACFAQLYKADYELFADKYPHVSDAISSLIRSMLCAPEGKDLLCADFSAIEARGLLWLCDDQAGLNKFRNGEDLYIDMAADIYSKKVSEVSKEERQLGKVAILGLGYGMGKAKFFDTCAAWGVVGVDKKLADKAVFKYRTKYNKVKNFWYEVEDAAKQALITRQKTTCADGKIKYKYQNGFLLCRLPSGRDIAYYAPKIIVAESPIGMTEQLTYMGTNSFTNKWERISTYGGKLVENITQGLCRDIMAEAMLRVEHSGYKIIMSVHDELVCEVDEAFGSLETFEKLMSKVPDWAAGFPIEAEGWRGKRYKK